MYLKDEVLAMFVGQRLRGLDDLVQIGVHELVNQVHILEASAVDRQHHILQGNHILMLDVPQELELPQGPQRVDPVLEHVVDLLDRDLLVRLPIDRRAHHAVRSFPDGLDGYILGVHLKQSFPH